MTGTWLDQHAAAFVNDPKRARAIELARAAAVGDDIPTCEHQSPDYNNCVVCAYHLGRAEGGVAAGAYFTGDEMHAAMTAMVVEKFVVAEIGCLVLARELKAALDLIRVWLDEADGWTTADLEAAQAMIARYEHATWPHSASPSRGSAE